jgi:galactose mutarotase-like enzyme
MPPTTEPGAGVSISSGPLDATFLPQLGMLGSSLRHRGEDLLALPGGLDGYRKGKVTGLPLLAPWANRLGARHYEVDGIVVDLEGLDLTTDENGLPIHGTMTAQPAWEVIAVSRSSLTARFDFGAHRDLMASFPFPHELQIEASVEATTLRVDTTLVPTGDRPVPVSFGYHPYLRLPGERRENVRLRLPERRHLQLDDRQLPTGRAQVEEAEDEPVGTRTFDDLYELGDDRQLAVTGTGRRLVLELGDGYGHAQVFTPPGAESICLEPMTAPVNALLDGTCALAMPGTSFTARFSLRVDGEN